MIYASEGWVMTKKESGKIQSAETQFLRNTLNYTLQDGVRNEDIRAELDVKDINEIIAIYRRQDVYKRQISDVQ